MSRLIRVDEAAFKDTQTIAALIGAQRFVMIWGEPSVADRVARVFDDSRVLLTGLVSTAQIDNPTASQPGAGPQQGGALAALSAGEAQPKSAPVPAWAQPNAERETSLNKLGNSALGRRPVDLPVVPGAL